MGARTGQEYVDRLAQTRPVVEINGERVPRGSRSTRRSASAVATRTRELYDLQHDSELRDVADLRVADVRRAGRHVVPGPAHRRGPRSAPRWLSSAGRDHSLGTLGRTGDYLNSALMALSEAGPGSPRPTRAFGENITRATTRLVREQDLLHDAHADPAAGQPRRRRSASRSTAARSARTSSTRTTTASWCAARGCSRRSARSPTSCSSSPRRCCAARPRTRRTRSRSRSTATRPACASSAASPWTTAPHFDHPLGVALRGDGRASSSSTTSTCRGSASSCSATRAVQRLLHRHVSAVVHMTHQVDRRARLAKTESYPRADLAA